MYSLEFVDFGGLLWRKAVSASRLIFSLETSSSSLDTTVSAEIVRSIQLLLGGPDVMVDYYTVEPY